MNKRMATFALATALVLGLAGNTFAQGRSDRRGGDRGGRGVETPRHMIGTVGMGKWWKNSQIVQKLGLSDAQVQQIEKVFQDHRLQLIDLRANLQKQEAVLQPLVETDQPNESQITAQIDKVAQARSDLEKNNARMFLAIRKVLTAEQWKTLQAERGTRMMPHGGGGGPAGPPAR